MNEERRKEERRNEARCAASLAPLQVGLLGLLSGGLYALGQPGFDLWPCAFVALVPLLWLIERGVRAGSGYRASLWAALASGVVAHLALFSWLAASLRDFFGTTLTVGVLSTLGFAFYGAGRFVLFAWLVQTARQRGISLVLAVLCATCLSEWLYPTVFEPHLGLALHSVPLLLQTADLGGPLLLSALVGVANAALACACVTPRKRKTWRELGWVLGAWTLALGYGAYRLAEVRAQADAAEKLWVGVVQTNSGVATDPSALRERVRLHVQQSQEITRNQAVDLLVWPESSFGWFLPEEATNVREYVEVGTTLRTPTLFGAQTRRTHQGEKRIFNSAVLANAQGDVLGIYDKNVLLPVGERIPFATYFPFLSTWMPRPSNYQAGERSAPLELGSHRIGVLICYEDVLASYVRRLVRNGDPALLVNVTNDAWFGDTLEPHQHFAASVLRSVEQRRALVRATHSGVSAVVAPTGEVVEKTQVFESAHLTAHVPLLAGQTVYAMFGDGLGPLAGLALALLAWRCSRPWRGS